MESKVGTPPNFDVMVYLALRQPLVVPFKTDYNSGPEKGVA